MWKLSLPWWEFIARALVVYIFLLVILRITGKRQVGQLAPFDLVLLLVLSNALQNSMNGGDNTVTGGLISAVTLICLNWLIQDELDAAIRLAGCASLHDVHFAILENNGQISVRARI